jgi:hypothetical protein
MDTEIDTTAERGSATDRNPKLIEIKINGRSFNVPKGDITFIQVVTLIYPDAGSSPQNIYTVTYKHAGGDKRVLVAGASVKVKEGMRFNVSQTGQS